jgi:UDP-4-amino-4,6-dideoxy-N-acetyl-beta-L-altrosamine transaminase
MIPYGRQFVDDDDIKEVVAVLKSDFLTTGPKIPEFEQKFASYVGSKFATAVSNGTAALHVACLAAGLKNGNELITTPMTFAASSNCALYCNAIPVFADITTNGLIDRRIVNQKANKRTKIIIPVHYAGFPCDLAELKEIANKNQSIVIEDACHALGSTYKGSMIGDCKNSSMAVFSFHPVKHITTGEGGIITTNSKELDERLKLFRTHGIVKEPQMMASNDGPWYYEMQQLGYNYRMTDIQAALGISQLRKVEKFVNRRKEIAEQYDDAFSNSPYLDFIKNEPNTASSYHLYPILLKDNLKRKKKAIFDLMRKNGLGVQVHYIPVYLHPYYTNLGFSKGICPIAEDFYAKEISIPMFYSLSDEQIEFVIQKVTDSIRQA